jgi:glycogen operon protein
MTVSWLNPGGGEQTPEQWGDPGSTTIGLRLSQEKSGGESWCDVLILFNPHDGDVPFAPPSSSGWTRVLDTADPDAGEAEIAGGNYGLTARSMVC